LVSQVYLLSFLPYLACFPGCFGHKTANEWLGLYMKEFVSIMLWSPREP
jgi:hypothetical protein